MRKTVPAMLSWVLAVLAIVPSAVSPLQADSKSAPPMKLKVGDTAPDFKMQYFDGNDLKDVTLSQYRGKQNVVLAFYIFAFTGG